MKTARSASADEAAAIAAAIERFVAETAAPEAAPEPVGPWQRAALAEGVGAKGTVQDPSRLAKGGARWQS